MLREAKAQATEAGYSAIRLNVNRHNEKAMRAYFRNGFNCVKMVDNPIGNGFYMNDFVMEAPLDGAESRPNIAELSDEESRRHTVLACLAEDFDYVCYINYQTGEFIRFRASAPFLKAVSEIDQRLPIIERLSKVLARLVHPDDLPSFLERISKERVLSELADKPVYKFEVRLIYNGRPKFFRIKFVHDQRNSNAVIVGFLDIDAQVKAEILQGEEEARKESMSELQELNRELVAANAFSDLFIGTYIYAYYVNLATDSMTVYHKSGKLADKYSEISGFHNFIEKYIGQDVHPDDRQTMLKMVNVENIRELMRRENEYSMIVRDISGETERYVRLHIVKGNDEDHVAIGFTDVDREYRDEQDKKLQMAQNLEIIGGLATEYTALYYLNLDTGTFKVYSISDRLADTKKLIHDKSDFMEVYRSFVMNSVHPDDREMLIRVTNPQNIREVLKDRKTYSVLFRRNYGGEYLWTEQIFVKFADKDQAASAIALGYIEKDKEVRANQEQEARVHRQEETLRKIILGMDSSSDIAKAVGSMLQTTAEYYGADRAFVFEADSAGQSFSNTYEWNADGVQSKKKHMQNIPNEKARPYLEKMDKSGICKINSLKDEIAQGRYMLLESSGVDSLVMAPITLDGAIVGFIGIDNPHDSTDDMVVLKTASTLIYGTVMRFKSEMLRRERDAQHDEVLVLQNMLHTARWSVKIGEDGHAYSVEWSHDMRLALGFDTEQEFPDMLDSWKSRVHPDDVDRFLTAYYSAMNDRTDATRFDMEHRIRNKDGKYRWFRAVCKFRRDETGRAISAIGVINDVSDVHELAKLQEKEKKYSDMAIALSESYECIYYVNLEDDTFLEFNKKDGFSTLDLEETSSDFFGTLRQNLSSNAYAEDLNTLSSFIDKTHIVSAISNGDTLSREYRMMDGDRQVYYRMKIAKSRSNDKFIVVAVENVDDEVQERNVQQKQLEEALHMAQAANRAKTAFLNNMSHDIRTPMNAIIGFSGLAASHIDNKEQVLNYLQKIGQSSDHLLSLINEVLDMSRIESGKMNLNEKPESLAEILHTLRDIIHADINAKQLDLFIDTVDVTNEKVICDKLRLNQALLNITSNAIKFTRPGGTIAIRIIQKAVLPSGYGSYEFHIKDNGIGMSEEYVKTIFEPFTRESTSTVSGIQGTGLGMAITKNIVDMMGGKIEVLTKKNEGTEFILTLDFKLADSTSSQPRKIPQLEGLRGLVVDDDSNTCLSVSRMLRDAGMRSEWCMSGKEALLRTNEALQIGDLYQVYIIDWIMPDMNGVETTRRIRKTVGNSVPIIILSAYDWSDIEDEAREAGVSGFVSKPMFPSDLQKVLAQFYASSEQDVSDGDGKIEFAGRKVLLVEDNELNREIAQELLEENGFKVATAADGTFAVEMMKAASPGDFDLILMDVQMPVMNGYDATRAIRAMGSEYCAKIPIVAMTANAFAEDRQAALDAGMNDHIAKPIKVDVLFDTLKRILS